MIISADVHPFASMTFTNISTSSSMSYPISTISTNKDKVELFHLPRAGRGSSALAPLPPPGVRAAWGRRTRREASKQDGGRPASKIKRNTILDSDKVVNCLLKS